MVLQSHMTNENQYNSATRVLMAYKVGRTVAFCESLVTIKSFYAYRVRPRDKQESLYIQTLYKHYTSLQIIIQTKTIVSLQQECLWKPNLAELQLLLMKSYLKFRMT